MKFFAKTFLIVLIIRIVKGEFQNCENENLKCRINEEKFPETEATDLNALIKHAVKYLNNYNQKYDIKINTIASDIGSLRNSLQTGSQKHTSCTGSLQKSLKAAKVEADVKAPASLYDNLWVIIQRRQEGAISFYRSWIHYKEGFGSPFREFFIGLDKIHYLTNSRPHELLIKFETFKGNLSYARYNEFLIGNETEKYQLKKLGNYSGTAGDYLRTHEGMYFSTRDRDNDASSHLHCAKLYQGGWWYNNCMTSNLNGPFRMRYEINNLNMTWGEHNETNFKIIQMMLRSKH